MASTYDAFISYSHAADGKLAPALQHALQRFAKPWYRLRALHLFRDQTSLSATPALWPKIEEALRNSRYFLLLASPEAATSRWVQQEVNWWLAHRSHETILIALTDGRIVRPPGGKDFDWVQTDALPPNLKGVFTETPLWVDLRWATGQAQFSPENPEFQNALASLAAPLRNIPKENLIGEDVRQHRRTKQWAWGAGIVLTVLLVAAVVAAAMAVRSRNRTLIANSQLFARQAETAYAEENLELAALLARESFQAADTSAARRALLQSIAAAPTDTLGRGNPREHDAAQPLSHILDVAFSPSGEIVASLDADSELRLWRLDNTELPSLQANVGMYFSVIAFSPDGTSIIVAGQEGAVQCKIEAITDCAEMIPESVTSIAFHPDGNFVVFGDELGHVTLWETESRTTLPLLDPTTRVRVNAVAVAANGWIAAGRDDGTTSLWSEDGNGSWTYSRTLPTVGDPSNGESARPSIRSLAFDPAGAVLVAGNEDGDLLTWEAPTFAPRGEPLDQGSRPVKELVFNATGSGLMAFDDAPQAYVWDMEGRSPIHVLDHGFLAITSAGISPDFSRIVTGDESGATRLWSADGLPLARYPPLNMGAGGVADAAFEPGAGRFAVGGADGPVRLCGQFQGDPQCELPFPATDRAVAVAFSAGGDWVAVGDERGLITVKRVGDEPQTLEDLEGFRIASLAIDEANALLAASGTLASPDGLQGAEENAVVLWNLNTRELIGTPAPQTSAVVVSFSPTCPTLVVAGGNQAHAWAVSEEGADSAHEKLVGRTSGIASSAFSQDGRRFAVGKDDGSVRIWYVDGECDLQNARAGGEMSFASVGAVTQAVTQKVAFTSDGRYLASGHEDGSVVLWDADSEQPLGLIGRLKARIVAVTWTEDLSVVAVDELGNVAELESDPTQWAEKACRVAGRDFSVEEALRHVGSESHVACGDVPAIQRFLELVR